MTRYQRAKRNMGLKMMGIPVPIGRPPKGAPHSATVYPELARKAWR